MKEQHSNSQKGLVWWANHYSKYQITLSGKSKLVFASYYSTAMIAARSSGFDCLQQLLLYATPS
jgi:hypothetical protein